MLQRGNPAVAHLEREVAVLGVRGVELAVLRAVVQRRSMEGVALNVEHGAFRARVVTQNLRVRRGLPRGVTAVLQRVLDPDAVLAAPEDERFRDADALSVRPREWHAQLRCTIELVLALGARSEEHTSELQS